MTREPAHHKVCLHRVLLFLVGVLQRYAQGVYDPYSRDQRQEVKHCVDVVLHHEAASPKKNLGFPLWHVCNCPVVTALAAGRSMHGVPCLPYIILHR